MKASDLYRWIGITGIVAGVVNAIVELLPDRIGLPLDLLVNILGLWVLTGLYARQREASGVFGFVSYVIQSFGLTLVVGFLFTQAFVLTALDAAQRAELLAGPTGLAALVALAVMILGAVLFGIATLRARVFPKWATLLFMAGFVLIAVAAFAPIIKTIGEGVLSAGLIGLSYALFSGAEAQNQPG